MKGEVKTEKLFIDELVEMCPRATEREISERERRRAEEEKIRKLRSDIVLASMNELPQDFCLAGTNRPNTLAKSLWDSDKPVKEKTIALLKALERLQIAQNNVHDKIKALDHSLSS